MLSISDETKEKHRIWIRPLPAQRLLIVPRNVRTACPLFGRRWFAQRPRSDRSTVGLLLVIVVLVLLFGGGGGYYAHSRYGLPGLGGVLGLVLVVLVVMWLFGGLGGSHA
jgi:hypothetical protein